MFLGQRDQPQGHLGQVHRYWVAVDTVEAALGDQPSGIRQIVLVTRYLRPGAVRVPGVHQLVSELAADLH